MVSCFRLTIHTALGSISGEEDANDAAQIKACMPEGVTAFSVDRVGDRPGAAPVSDEELWLNLCSAIEHIAYASTLTPEAVAELHAEQIRALGGLCVEAKPTDNPALASKLSNVVATLGGNAT
jgi:hypothetical protein